MQAQAALVGRNFVVDVIAACGRDAAVAVGVLFLLLKSWPRQTRPSLALFMQSRHKKNASNENSLFWRPICGKLQFRQPKPEASAFCFSRCVRLDWLLLANKHHSADVQLQQPIRPFALAAK